MSGIFGRDEMNALIGGPATGGGEEEMAAFRQSGGQRNPHQSSRGTSAVEADVSKMTPSEAATMLSEKSKTSGASNSTVRYRTKNNKVLEHHQLLAEELYKQQQQQQQEKSTTATKILPKKKFMDDDDDDEDDDYDGEFVRKKRPVQTAQVISRQSRSTERRRRRRRSDSSSSSSSSSDEEASQKQTRRGANNRKNRLDRRRAGNESSSSSSSDEEDDRRRNQRVLASRKTQEEPKIIVPTLKSDAKESVKTREERVGAEEKGVDHEHERKQNQQPQVERMISDQRKPTGTSRATHSSSDEEDSDSSSSSSSGSSSGSSSSSSSEEEDEPVRLKPVFVPKHKRNLVQSEEKKFEEEELKARLEKERDWKRKAESRALVAKELAEASLQNNDDDDEDEEAGGAINAPPNDDDELHPEKEKHAWEVRELKRLLKSIDEQETRKKEETEYLRRMKLTDEECLKEDIESGRYQAPGANRNKKSSGESGSSVHLNRFFHRGAYYMDDSEWEEGDIRRKAVEYAAAATGEDKIDKSKLPEVMQVKNFGRGGQNNRYKGLAKEDTTDKSAPVLPLRRPKR